MTFKNIYATETKLNGLIADWNKRQGLSNSRFAAGLTTLNDVTDMTSPTTWIVSLPVPGYPSPFGAEVIKRGDAYRAQSVGNQKFGFGFNFELDPVYETYKGHTVKDGWLYIAIEYKLPSYYDTYTFAGLDDDAWKELTTPESKDKP